MQERTARNYLRIAAASLLLVASAPASVGAAEPAGETVGQLVPVSQFTLANGLRVAFHVDRSDPVAAVVLAAHVGSGREIAGRTGFAHMFEHLFFLDSENLGPGGLDKLTARVGGSGANGFTNRDQTIYLQTVPNDALEKMIWAEADKLGYFIGTVTEAVVTKEKQVVKNEKRQAVDNVPYGHAPGVFFEAMYPKGHPYSWTTIGSLADLDAASLDDVRQFHRRWYTPNNATLVIAGDFDPVQARRWVERYFGDIPRGAPAARPTPQPARLTASKRLAYEDSFAQLPQLSIGWPAVPAFDRDAPAFWVLFELLARDPDAPLRKILVEEQKLTDQIETIHNDSQMSGEAVMVVRAFDGVDLDRVEAAIGEGFKRFERDGVDPAALARAKASWEARLLQSLESVQDKAAAIARYDGFLGRPDFADTELANLRGVTADDVLRVYRRHVAGQPHIVTSFVPKGKGELALRDSLPAQVVEEKIVQGAEAALEAPAGPAARPKTASSFDRTVEPPAGTKPVVKPPRTWSLALANGLTASGIEDREFPVARFELAIDGGRLRDDPAKPGVANLVAAMLTRGTLRRSRTEFEKALSALGGEIAVEARDEHLVVRGSVLSRNAAPALALVEEMLLQPRWDTSELALAKAAAIAGIQADRADPGAVAERVFRRATYGPGHVLAGDPRGTEASVAALTLADLKAFHAQALAPNAARLRLVGDVAPATVGTALNDLEVGWTKRPLKPLPPIAFAKPATSRVYFRDIPGAKQSMLMFGVPGPRRADPDFYPATAANFVLGGGGFASRLTQQVREAKGYTYGVRSRFEGGTSGGRFVVQSPVRSNVTAEAATLIRDIVRDYGRTYTPADLDLTRTSMAKSRARAFETPAAKLGMLAAIGDYGLPADYVAREGAVLDALTLDQVRGVADRYIDTARMTFVVVGDAATQRERLKALGYGEAMLVEEK